MADRHGALAFARSVARELLQCAKPERTVPAPLSARAAISAFQLHRRPAFRPGLDRHSVHAGMKFRTRPGTHRRSPTARGYAEHERAGGVANAADDDALAPLAQF